MLNGALTALFEEQIEFRLRNGTSVEGSIFIGETEFLPVEVLREDPDAYRDEFNRWLRESWLPDRAERREQILALHGNRKRFADLIDATIRQQVIPLIGSGMSVPSGLPTWSNLLRAIRRYTKIAEADLECLIRRSAFEEAADLIASAANKNLLNERVEHDLRIDDIEMVDGPIRLLPAIFSNVVLTTNLDDVLEQHYRNSDASFNHVLAGKELARFRQLKNPRERFLLKLHGDCRRADSRVLLTVEYDAAYRGGSAIREELALLYRSNHILFVGCSLGPDRTVGLIREVSGGDEHMPKHYAFLELPCSDEVRIDREHFLTERGIYPIWYDGPHDEALTALLAGLLDTAEVEAKAVAP